MQRFNECSVQSKFIQALLYNTPIPNIEAVMEGDYIIQGYSYIYNYDVIYCNESGIVGGEAVREFPDGYATWTPLYEYTRERHNVLYEERHFCKSGSYDSDTHEWLGNYLRFYRGLTGVDLLPFYNCFSNRQIGNIKIDTEERIVYKHNFPDYKIYRIPIRFNKKYTIALDCPSRVVFAGCFLDQNNILEANSYNSFGEALSDLNAIIWKKDGCIQSYSSTSFKNPIVFELENKTRNNEQWLRMYEKDLSLLIQVPFNNTSSVVVLEGDYTQIAQRNVFSLDNIDMICEAEQNRLMLTDLSLLRFNDGVQHPYAPRLLEYLVGNAITKEEDIPKNIYRLNQYIKDGGYFNLATPKLDTWWDDTRFGVYRFQSTHKELPRYDLNGYVDKDTEALLIKEQEKRDAERERLEQERLAAEKRANYGYWNSYKPWSF